MMGDMKMYALLAIIMDMKFMIALKFIFQFIDQFLAKKYFILKCNQDNQIQDKDASKKEYLGEIS